MDKSDFAINPKHGLECSVRVDFNPTCEAEASIAKHAKGQSISKELFGVIVWTKKNPRFFKDFCPSI